MFRLFLAVFLSIASLASCIPAGTSSTPPATAATLAIVASHAPIQFNDPSVDTQDGTTRRFRAVITEAKRSLAHPTAIGPFPAATLLGSIGRSNNPVDGTQNFGFFGHASAGGRALISWTNRSDDTFGFYHTYTVDSILPVGYLYNAESGLCVSLTQTSASEPHFTGADMTLQECDTLTLDPPPNQKFLYKGIEVTKAGNVSLVSPINDYMYPALQVPTDYKSKGSIAVARLPKLDEDGTLYIMIRIGKDAELEG